MKISLSVVALLSGVAGSAFMLNPVSSRAQTAVAPSNKPPAQLEEVIVTAQKRTQDVKNIPISISAIGGAALARAHITGYEDLTRSVPSVSFAAGGGNGVGEGETFIEVRGVSSTSGSATTGLYLDDTSITVSQASGVGGVQPLAVDLNRIEVLRGPQGTLYGASSEGGTVRFIENQANLAAFEGKIVSDVSGTFRGGVNYMELGVVNIPIIPDKLAIRGNFAYGDDSGWIDNYSLTGQLQKKGVNSVRHELVRLNIVAKPANNLTITTNLFYQRNNQNDAPIFEIQDPAFAAANASLIPPPVPSDGLYRQHFLTQQYARDQLFVPSLTVQYSADYGDFTSISSYLQRNFQRQTDGQDYDSYFLANLVDSIIPNSKTLSGMGNLAAPVVQPARFNTYSEEFRFNSHRMDVFNMPVHLVAGFYFSDQQEFDRDYQSIPGISAAFESIYGYGINSAQSPLGDPAYSGFWTNDSITDQRSYQDTRQYAGFGQIDIDLLPRLHASAGFRYVFAQFSSTFESSYHFFDTLGPDGSLFIDTKQNDYAGTPKFSLTYDVTDQTNIYATISEGYRLGGANTSPPPTGQGNVCQADYTYLGITAPTSSFGPDHLWSYELGSKMRLLDNTLSIDGAGYDIEWSQIQQSFYLPFCGYPYTLNVGAARSYGAEFQVSYKPSVVPGLTVGLNGNISHATITQSDSPTVVAVGQNVLFVPVYSLNLSGEYRWTVSGRYNFFVRGDYDMTGRSYGSYITSNPGYVNHPYAVLNGSIGLTEGLYEVDLYAKNLLDNHTIIQTPTLNLQVTGYTVRPLTIGIAATRKF